MKRTQTGGSRLLLTLLILIFSIGLSACAGRNSPEVILTTPDITEPPSESAPAETQPPASTQTPAETRCSGSCAGCSEEAGKEVCGYAVSGNTGAVI